MMMAMNSSPFHIRGIQRKIVENGNLYHVPATADDVSSETSLMSLRPLTPHEKDELRTLVNLYGHYWENPRFREGFMHPLFTRVEVEDLLEQAAEYVIRIRHHLDTKIGWDQSKRKGKKAKEKSAARLLMGKADEFLWSVNFKPQQQPRRFVRGLIHASFQDQVGYVEGLTKEAVNDYIAEIDDYNGLVPDHHHRDPDRCRRCHPLEETQPTPRENNNNSNKSTPKKTRKEKKGEKGTTDWEKVASRIVAQTLDYLDRVSGLEEITKSARMTDQWINICHVMDDVNNQLALMYGLHMHPSPEETRHEILQAQVPKPALPVNQAEGIVAAGGEPEFPTPLVAPLPSAEAWQREEQQQRQQLQQTQSAATPADSRQLQHLEEIENEWEEKENEVREQEGTFAVERSKSELEIEVARVQDDVHKVQGEFQSLLSQCHNLNVEDLLKAKGGTADQIQCRLSRSSDLVNLLVHELQTKVMKSSETLMADLLKLDRAVVASREDHQKRSRTVSPNQVDNVQSVLREVTLMNERLSRLQDVLTRTITQSKQEQQPQQPIHLSQHQEQHQAQPPPPTTIEVKQMQSQIQQQQQQPSSQVDALKAGHAHEPYRPPHSKPLDAPAPLPEPSPEQEKSKAPPTTVVVPPVNVVIIEAPKPPTTERLVAQEEQVAYTQTVPPPTAPPLAMASPATLHHMAEAQSIITTTSTASVTQPSSIIPGEATVRDEETRVHQFVHPHSTEPIPRSLPSPAHAHSVLPQAIPTEGLEISMTPPDLATQRKLLQLREVVLDEQNWTKVAMEPNFVVSQQRNRFIIQGYVPNMKREDLGVNLSPSGEFLVLSGLRLPTMIELKEMLTQLEAGLTNGLFNSEQFLTLSIERLLISLGGGRFGAFQKQYRLPTQSPDLRVLTSAMAASYSNGVLTVTLPVEVLFGPRFYEVGLPVGAPPTFLPTPIQPLGFMAQPPSQAFGTIPTPAAPILRDLRETTVGGVVSAPPTVLGDAFRV